MAARTRRNFLSFARRHRAHRWLHDHPRCANALLIGTSALIDIVGLWLLLSALFGPSFGPFLGLLMLFALRQVCQGLCALPPPPGMIWRSPGFPTALVTYGTSTDLFFSGHTALAVYGGLELAHQFGGWGIAAGVAFVTIEIATVLVLRAHYTLDVIAGAFRRPVGLERGAIACAAGGCTAGVPCALEMRRPDARDRSDRRPGCDQ